MKPKLKNPNRKLVYDGEDKIEYRQTSFRLPVSQVKKLERWANEIKDDARKRGSVNDLMQTIIDWALEHKGTTK